MMNPNVGFRTLIALGFICLIFTTAKSADQALAYSLIVFMAFIFSMVLDANTRS